MLSRICRPVSVIILTLATAMAVAEPPQPLEPPAPESKLPAVPDCQSPGTCRLPCSDSLSTWNTLESLPECHPLPDLTPAIFRQFHVTPGVTVTGFFANAPASTVAVGKNTRWAFVDASGVRRISVSKASDKPEALAALQHLIKAAEHLEAAGKAGAAAQIRHEAERMQHHAHQRLQELRRQEQQIKREIKDLEQLTGNSAKVEFDVTGTIIQK